MGKFNRLIMSEKVEIRVAFPLEIEVKIQKGTKHTECTRAEVPFLSRGSGSEPQQPRGRGGESESYAIFFKAALLIVSNLEGSARVIS